MSSYRISCIRERREIENLCDEKTRLESSVTEFKNNNKEYLDKIKQAAEVNVKSVLTNGKILLNFATASAIESLRRNSEFCNFVLNDISNNNDDVCTAVILEESEKLYNKLTTELTDTVMAATASSRTSLLPSVDNMQKLTYKKNNTYQTEELRYSNNQPEIYSNDK